MKKLLTLLFLLGILSANVRMFAMEDEDKANAWDDDENAQYDDDDSCYYPEED